MKVFVQIIDSRTGVYQNGMIDEPVKKGSEIENAIKHFVSSDIEWISEVKFDNTVYKVGKIKETTKIISIITI